MRHVSIINFCPNHSLFSVNDDTQLLSYNSFNCSGLIFNQSNLMLKFSKVKFKTEVSHEADSLLLWFQWRLFSKSPFFFMLARQSQDAQSPLCYQLLVETTASTNISKAKENTNWKMSLESLSSETFLDSLINILCHLKKSIPLKMGWFFPRRNDWKNF